MPILADAARTICAGDMMLLAEVCPRPAQGSTAQLKRLTRRYSPTGTPRKSRRLSPASLDQAQPGGRSGDPEPGWGDYASTPGSPPACATHAGAGLAVVQPGHLDAGQQIRHDRRVACCHARLERHPRPLRAGIRRAAGGSAGLYPDPAAYQRLGRWFQGDLRRRAAAREAGELNQLNELHWLHGPGS